LFLVKPAAVKGFKGQLASSPTTKFIVNVIVLWRDDVLLFNDTGFVYICGRNHDNVGG